MKIKTLVVSALMALVLAAPSFAQNKGGFTVTASALYSYLANISNTKTDLKSGAGGYLYGDYQPLDWMAIGLGGGYTQYFKGDLKSIVESVDVVGRLMMPDNAGKRFIPYLIGAVGYRPMNKDAANVWYGHYRAMAGVGGRLDVTGSGIPGSGLDIALVVNAYTPKEFIMKTADLRVGYSFAFGGGEGGVTKKVSAPKPQAAEVQLAQAATPVVEAAAALAKVVESPVAAVKAAVQEPSIEEPAEKPIVAAVAKPKAPVAAAPAVKGAWWAIPFSAPDAFTKLKTEIIPERVKKTQMEQLGQEAKLFFNKVEATGTRADFVNYRAGYYTAIAAEHFNLERTTKAKYYLDQALKIKPDFKEALDLKAKMAGGQ